MTALTGEPLDAAAADALAEELAGALGREVGRTVPLAQFSTYRLGGPAAILVEPESPEELHALADVTARRRPPLLMVGRGSNLLVADTGFPGVVVHLAGAFDALEVRDTVDAGAAVALPRLARQTAAAGRTGLEFFVGIPGSVGGAVKMNAGGHGRETAEVLREVVTIDLLSGDRRERSVNELDLGYRRSSVGDAEIVVRAAFATDAADPGECEQRIADIVRWRREHQPGGSNAGSVFTNPPGDSAGRLIDECGLKGHRVGGAVVSEKHANFFQAEAGASADDVHRLVRDVQRIVADRTGIHLEPELTQIGFSDDKVTGDAREPGEGR